MSKRIVLFEADALLAELYASALAKSGFKPVLAQSAQETVDLLDKKPADLLIMDVLQAGHNGIEVLHEVRSYDDWHDVPIVLLSSLPKSDLHVSGEQWQRYGVAKFLYKPQTKPHDLVEAVQEVL